MATEKLQLCPLFVLATVLSSTVVNSFSGVPTVPDTALVLVVIVPLSMLKVTVSVASGQPLADTIMFVVVSPEVAGAPLRIPALLKVMPTGSTESGAFSNLASLLLLTDTAFPRFASTSASATSAMPFIVCGVVVMVPCWAISNSSFILESM